MPNILEDKDWDILLRRIKEGRCTPFLGAGASYPAIPLGSTIAEELAKKHDYPLEDCHQLPRVAQYIALKNDDFMTPKEDIQSILTDKIKTITPQYFEAPDEPHGVLADLPLPVYITTNYDNFMLQALKSRKKIPKDELCRWNKYLKQNLSPISDLNPSPENPVVFHLHGHYDTPESMVLTEDDYLDFLVNISKEENLIPTRIQQSFTGSSILFLGYGIADWNFRVIFRTLIGYMEKSLSRAHISVQLLPVGDTMAEDQKEKVRNYLNRYFKNLNISVYWGNCREFAAELRRRWEEFKK